jgi:hypothetical protein
MIQIRWTRPQDAARSILAAQYTASPQPLYLAAGLPLLQQMQRELFARGAGSHGQSFVLAGFLERTFLASHPDWRRIGPMEQRMIMGQPLCWG